MHNRGRSIYSRPTRTPGVHDIIVQAGDVHHVLKDMDVDRILQLRETCNWILYGAENLTTAEVEALTGVHDTGLCRSRFPAASGGSQTPDPGGRQTCPVSAVSRRA